MRDRRRAYAWGLRAEALAALSLQLKGYRVLSRRWRTRGGEVDLVVKRGRTIAFVEVKARSSFDSAAFALTPRGEARIARAAETWIAARRPQGLDMRFDLVLVTPRRWPRHVPDAFRPALR